MLAAELIGASGSVVGTDRNQEASSPSWGAIQASADSILFSTRLQPDGLIVMAWRQCWGKVGRELVRPRGRPLVGIPGRADSAS
jgi:hypothetical protein